MAIRLYTTRDNTGTSVTYNDACAALPDGLNDKTLSLQTDKGESWRVWTDVDYKGTESPVLSGTYDFDALLQYGLVHADGKGRISSLQKIPSNAASLGSITLYQGKNLDGASRTCSAAMSALDSGWNDATRSCEVTGSAWIVYVDNGYSSSAATLGVGRYTFDDLARFGMVHADSGAGRISSLRPLVACPQASWMARVRGDVLLSDLTIPGTHDSCTYVGTLVAESRCQSMGIREQLIAGIRCLDLRPKLIGAFRTDPGAKLTIYHGTNQPDPSIDTHIDLQDVIDDCAAFLAASPDETIVVSIKNDDANTGNEQWFIDILWKYFNRNASLWYLDEALPMLGDVRGKLVLFRQFDLPAGVRQVKCGLPVDIGWGGSDGKHRDDFTIDCGSWSLRGQDNYSDPIPKWDHIKALLDAAVATPTLSVPAMKSTLFVNFTSAVWWGGIPSTTSDDINPKLCHYLRTGAQGRRLGIIPMDFPGEAIGRLIDRNLFLAPSSLPPRISLQATDGQFVCAEGGGGGTVVANRAQAAAWETFEVCVVDDSSGKIGLRCANGCFLSAEGGGGQSLAANRTDLAAWETFTVRIVDKAKGLITLQAYNGQYVQAGGGAVLATANGASPSATLKFVVPATLMTSMPTTIALQTSNGLHVRAENGGGSTVVTHRGEAAAWETFTVVPVDAAKGQYALQASNKSFVCAENGGGSVLVANRAVRSTWETFTIYRLGGDRIAIKAYNGQYVQADAVGGSVDAKANWVSQSATFKLVAPATLMTSMPTRIALQASNGLYVCAENGGGSTLVANRGEAAAWETFTVVPVDAAKGQYALQASNKSFVCAENGGGSVLVANRTVRSTWETFTIYQIGGDRIAIRASNGQYVRADNGGGAGLSAVSGFVLTWETFTRKSMS